MARLIELLVIVNGVAGIATFLGVRFIWRRSKSASKRGFQIIHADKEECPICHQKFEEEEMHQHLLTEHTEELQNLERSISRSYEQKSNTQQLPSPSQR